MTPAQSASSHASTSASSSDHSSSDHSSFDSVLLDLDGVVYSGPHALPGAVPALDGLAQRDIPFGFVTNNASRSSAHISSHLTDLGLRSRPELVTTSGVVAARAMADELPAGSRVLVVGSEALRDLIHEAGFTVVSSAEDRPDALVQGFFRSITWYDIAEACVAVAAGVPWWATNPDLTMPTERGLLPGNGAFVRTVADTTGRSPRITGKPGALMLRTAAAVIGGEAPIMVGDRLDTDVAAARAAGYTSALVLTGIHDIHDALRASPEHRPEYILGSLTDLLAPAQPVHLAPAAGASADSGPGHPRAARCGDATVTLENGVLRHSGPAVAAANAALALLADLPADTGPDIDETFPRRADD